MGLANMIQNNAKLYKPILVFAFFLSTHTVSMAQADSCNRVGAWIWHIEHTGYTHAQLADTLVDYGFKRAYIKVAQGTIIPTWSELLDTALVNDYHAAGLEIWAWSYNRVGDDSLQAEAAYLAAQTGYDGYVIDVETEFDGDSLNLYKLCSAFDKAMNRAKADGIADSSYQLYVTTWGNPIDHNFYISAMDPFVDGYMPQTYVEYWGQSYINNLVFWIDSGTTEYQSIGATKPIHHLMSTATETMTPNEMEQFIMAAGPEASVWRVPGSSVPMSVWGDWRRVNWGMDYCAPNFSVEEEPINFTLYPNPTKGLLKVEAQVQGIIRLVNLKGQVLKVEDFQNQKVWNLDGMSKGIYLIQIEGSGRLVQKKLVVL